IVVPSTTNRAQFDVAPTASDAFDETPITADAGEVMRVVRPELRQLPDGSWMELAPSAKAEIAYTPTERRIHLLSGNAYFGVAKDPERPFVVTAGHVSVKAVGTQFAVRAESSAINVLVTEGQVVVDAHIVAAADAESNSASSSVMLGEGLGIEVIRTGAGALSLQSLTDQDMQTQLKWRHPRLLLDGTPLRQVVDYFNRTQSIRILLEDDKVGKLRLTGVCVADDVGELRELIEVAIPVTSRIRDDGVIEIKAR
ncbi:MAG: FecR domain-containing protein, partial [Opitutaceae bacterium]|nr:FecR domain-containing protein [Opitutaceae bacterium]